jgi:hypothetical protein
MSVFDSASADDNHRTIAAQIGFALQLNWLDRLQEPEHQEGVAVGKRMGKQGR